MFVHFIFTNIESKSELVLRDSFNNTEKYSLMQEGGESKLQNDILV